MEAPAVIAVQLDGLRPDCLREEWTPNLLALARGGARFLRHRSTFPTSTRVCVSTLVTGVSPRKHGLPGNALYARDLDPPRPISTGRQPELALWEEAAGGRLLLRRTLFERLARRGLAGAIISVASSGSAWLWNAGRPASLLHPDVSWPPALRREAESAFGPLPASGTPDLERCRWALEFALDYALPRLKPRALVVHLSEPDTTQHHAGAGGALPLSALRGVDRLLGAFLQGLGRLGLRERTNLLVFSDHGMLSTLQAVDLDRELADAGLPGRGPAWEAAHSEGAALFYARGRGLAPLLPVAEFLRAKPWAGPLFSRDGRGAEGRIPGTFSLSLAGCGGGRGPDLLMAFQWGDGPPPGAEGGGALPGWGFSSVRNKGRGGSHGSASPYEMHNVLLASGPAFPRGVEVDAPTGNLDIAPTLLSLGGLPLPAGLEGRPLDRGFRGRGLPRGRAEALRVEGRSGAGGYVQTLRRTRAGGRVFLDSARLERS